MFKTLELVYRNMVVGRPKFGLYGLIALALICTTNVYFSFQQFGHGAAVVFGIVTFTLWFFALPMVMTLIDLKMKPQRLEKIWDQMHKQ